MIPGDTAPPQRLAAVRVVLGVFVTGYLLIRFPMFWELGDRAANRFDPVGVFVLIGRPLAGSINDGVLVATILLGVLFTLGWRFRAVAPVFALGVLTLTSHRSSWGQMLHFENLMTLHVIVIALAASADAWSLDARRRATRGVAVGGAAVGGAAVGGAAGRFMPNARYGVPLQIASLIVVVTYVIAGIAKLRYGGLDWITGDTLRNHIAYSATRLDLLGATRPPMARLVVDVPWLLRPAAALSVLLELGAPIALLGKRLRSTWVASAWLMHAGIYATMLVGFPSPLFLVAFAPMFELERPIRRWRSAMQLRVGQPIQAGRRDS